MRLEMSRGRSGEIEAAKRRHFTLAYDCSLSAIALASPAKISRMRCDRSQRIPRRLMKSGKMLRSNRERAMPKSLLKSDCIARKLAESAAWARTSCTGSACVKRARSSQATGDEAQHA